MTPEWRKTSGLVHHGREAGVGEMGVLHPSGWSDLSPYNWIFRLFFLSYYCNFDMHFDYEMSVSFMIILIEIVFHQ